MCHGQLLSQKLVQARKRHVCDSCGDGLEIGVRYVRTNAVVDGDMQTSALCVRCQAILEAYYHDMGGFDDCFSLKDLRELVRQNINNTGMWAQFKRLLREKLKTVATQGAWHT